MGIWASFTYLKAWGGVQHFTFQENECGPFGMTERMRSEQKEDKVVEGAKKVKKS
jgi:hypothetical protein